MSKKTNRTRVPVGPHIFVKQFRHWRSKKIIRAADYGKKAFRIFIRPKKAS
jgi:hypothetical protein